MSLSPAPALDAASLTQVPPVGAADRAGRRPGSITVTPSIEGLGAVMMSEVRKLTASDAAAFQALRLEGLANHPCEFGTAFEEEADLPIAEIERRLEESRIYGAFVGDGLAALAGFRRFDRIKKAHKGELFGVYAGKGFRGRGLGEAVVRKIIDVARSDVEQLLATVASLNLPAKALYAKLGFEPFGHEPRGQKVGDRYYDQDHLLLRLR
jgi:RimJ/RimL family protein N-acetyltransferase